MFSRFGYLLGYDQDQYLREDMESPDRVTTRNTLPLEVPPGLRELLSVSANTVDAATSTEPLRKDAATNTEPFGALRLTSSKHSAT